jgi:hypothetical protein
MWTAAQARYVDCTPELGFKEKRESQFWNWDSRLLRGVGRPAWSAVIIKANVQANRIAAGILRIVNEVEKEIEEPHDCHRLKLNSKRQVEQALKGHVC